MDNKYNAFEHLWRSVFPFDAKERVMVMLAGYFDESGMDGQSPVVAVGGYVSTVDLWEEFQKEWKPFLKKNGLEYLHVTDLLSPLSKLRKEKGWDDAEAQQIMQKADHIIEKYTLFGAVATVNIAEIEAIFPLKAPGRKSRRKFSVEYAIAGQEVLKGVAFWARENDYTEPIEYVMEDGAHGKGYLVDTIRRAWKIPEMRASRLIGGIDLKDKIQIVQLQPADGLVNLSCKAIVSFVQGKQSETEMVSNLIKAKVRRAYKVDGETVIKMRDQGLAKKYGITE